jgi:hypothetical protein
VQEAPLIVPPSVENLLLLESARCLEVVSHSFHCINNDLVQQAPVADSRMAAAAIQQQMQQWLSPMQQAAQQAGRHLLQQPASAPRVLGVGVGVFLLAFFL